jgi:plasmid stabilization system protein ParE
MVDRVILLPRAIREAADARGWYESRRGGLGDEFVQSVERCIESIRRTPELYAFAHEQYRRALVRRFPYAAFYEYTDEAIIVYSVFHCSQDPEKLHESLP